MIWTTTVWTLPGNLAVCLNNDFEYAFVKINNEYLIIAKELVESVMKTAKIEHYKIVGKAKGEKLEGIKCKHPFLDRDSLVILGDHVTLDAGTGCVHTAPGHGAEDFYIGQKYNLPVVVPVDDKGFLTKEAGQFAGLFYSKSNKHIAEHLESTNHLLAKEKIVHQYPHCWRCKKPIVFRATEQWFASIDKFRNDAQKGIESVNWVPEWEKKELPQW